MVFFHGNEVVTPKKQKVGKISLNKILHGLIV